MSALRDWNDFKEAIKVYLYQDPENKYSDFSTLEGLQKQFDFVMENQDRQGQIVIFIAVDPLRSVLPFTTKTVEIYKGRVIE